MKKKMFMLFFMMILLFPICANAESIDKCTIVSGNGSSIGDEIECGTERFYILSNDGENIRMLSKYNLYAGITYDVIEFNQTFANATDAENYYNANYISVYDGRLSYLSNEEGNIYGALIFNFIEVDEIKQSSEAIGSHSNSMNETLFPEIGAYSYAITQKFDAIWSNYIYTAYSKKEDNAYKSGYVDFEINLNSTKDAVMLDYFKEYSKYLEGQGIVVEDMTILSVSDINDLVYEISGKYLPLEESWNNRDNWNVIKNNIYEYSIVADISNYLSDNYNWLWSTTYWTKTVSTIADGNVVYLIDTKGNLSNANFINITVGSGVRPVVTMASDNLIYNVETKTDGNGKVTSNKVQSVQGEEVEFTVEAKEGYQLKKVIVTTSTGNKVEFADYKFTMPNESVEIYAEFEKIENPNTGLSNPFIICGGILGIAVVGSLVVKKKKYI